MIIEEKGLYRDAVYAMWQRNFHDPAPYADFYFDEVYGQNEILLNVSGKQSLHAAEIAAQRELKGMLHLNPYEIKINGKTVPAHYIVGVATDEDYRRQGVMRELLTETFSRLRRQGEIFTYLMPADVQYYLPFDFRFGFGQVEQEIECFGQAASVEQDGGYTFLSGLPEKIEEICEKENEAGGTQFVIHTKITPEYIIRLEKETQSDFAQFIKVFNQGEYAGRFVVGAENDYMVLSRVFCVCREKRKDFLYYALNYCENKYHYGKYQLVLDESWEDIVQKAGSYQGARLLPARKKNNIMFRIINIEKMGEYLCGDFPAKCYFQIQDNYLKEQDGVYLWSITEDGSRIQKSGNNDESILSMQKDAYADGGRISIGALTEIIFGHKHRMDESTCEGLTDEGKAMLKGLHSLHPGCFQEIV